MSTLAPDPSPNPPSEPPTHLQTGDLVGRFRIEGMVAQGGMGSVFKAWDTTLERHVCLKAIRLEQRQTAQALERFRREALALAQFSHPHVCQVYDWIEAQGQPYIQMEWIDGKSLEALPEDLPLVAKLTHLRAVADALAEAHRKGIVHRDLKPSNLMLDPHGRIRILDFGLVRLDSLGDSLGEPTASLPLPSALATLVGEATQGGGSTTSDADATLAERSGRGSSLGTNPGHITEDGCFVGSPSYASPEQIRGAVVGPPSDVFSLGILAQEWITGTHPFPGKVQDKVRAILEGRRVVPMAGVLPRRLLRLLEAMLAPDLRKRPTAAEVVQNLDRILRPRPLWHWALAGALATGVVFGALYWALGRGVVAEFGARRPARLAILPLENQTGDSSLDAVVGHGFPEVLGASLRGLPRVVVLDSATLQAAMTSLKLEPARPLTPALRRQLMQALGCQLLVEGALRKGTSSHLLLDLHLRDREDRDRFQVQRSRDARDPSLTLALPVEVGRRLREAIQPTETREAGGSPSLVSPSALKAFAEGKAAMGRGDYKGAEPHLRQAAYDAPTFPAALVTYGECLAILGDPAEAPVFQWARLAAHQVGDTASEIRILGQMGLRARLKGDLRASLELLRSAVDLAQRTRDRDQEAGALMFLGATLRDMGQGEEAAAVLTLAVELKRSQGDLLGEARILNTLAMLHQTQDRLGTAEPLYTRSLELMRELGHRGGEANALNNLGTLAALGGRLAQAQASFESCLRLQRTLGYRLGEAAALNNLGVVLQMLGQGDRALDTQAEGVEIARKGGFRTQEAVGTFYLAHLYLKRGKPLEALTRFRNALALLPPSAPKGLRGQTLAGIAEALGWSTEEARTALDEATQIAPTHPYVLRAQTLAGPPQTRREKAELALRAARSQAPELVQELESLRKQPVT